MFGIKNALFLKAPHFWWRPVQGRGVRFLSYFGVLWTGLARLKRALSEKPIQAPFPVISVGNLVMGGAGKTPVTLWLARLLQQHAICPLVVSRGFGGSIRHPLKVDPACHTVEQVGDEALCMVKHVPCYVASPRRGVLALLKDASSNSVLMLDDAHQHTSLIKDLSFVVVDQAQGFGNGHVPPAGPLREPIHQGLGRANGVILIGEPSKDLEQSISRHAPHVPLFHAKLHPIPSLAPNTPVLGFAGIGFPAKFEQTLQDLGLDIVGFEAFPDHYPYKRRDVERLKNLASQAQATLVTTEKDWVRLPKDIQDQVHVIQIEIQMKPESEAALKALVMHRLRQQKRNL